MTLAVCIITYKRPNGLMRVLNGIGAQRFREQRPDIRVIAVDNDQAGSAGPMCVAVRPDFAWALECYIEPRRGIRSPATPPSPGLATTLTMSHSLTTTRCPIRIGSMSSCV